MFTTILVAAFRYLLLWTVLSVALTVVLGVWALSLRARPGQEPPARPGDME